MNEGVPAAVGRPVRRYHRVGTLKAFFFCSFYLLSSPLHYSQTEIPKSIIQHPRSKRTNRKEKEKRNNLPCYSRIGSCVGCCACCWVRISRPCALPRVRDFSKGCVALWTAVLVVNVILVVWISSGVCASGCVFVRACVLRHVRFCSFWLCVNSCVLIHVKLLHVNCVGFGKKMCVVLQVVVMNFGLFSGS